MRTNWGLHLKQRNGWWHYYRTVPNQYQNFTQKRYISFALKTRDFTIAKQKAVQISVELEAEWQKAKIVGVSLRSVEQAEKHQAANQLQKAVGFEPMPAREFSDQDMIERLLSLLQSPKAKPEQKAILGLVEKPEMSLHQAMERFWDYIKDEWSLLSHDQKRVKHNLYQRTITNFEKAVGVVPLHEIKYKRLNLI